MIGAQSNDGAPVIRVLIADDHPVVRTGLAAVIAQQPGLELVAEAEDGLQALARFREHRPDVVLMDMRMPGMDGVGAIRAIRAEFPDARILALTTYEGDADIHRALEAGARGYLLKDMPAGDLAQAIRLARAGLYQLDPGVAGKLVGALGRRGPSPEAPVQPAPPVPLTARELAVLRLIARGATNREIADKLVISEGTVKNHISSILSRLGLRDRTEAAIYAHQHQLL